MRILFVNRMLGIAWGGGENYDSQLASALSEFGVEVSFLGGRAANGADSPAQPAATQLQAEWVTTPYWRHWMYRLGGRIPYIPGVIAEADLHLFQRAAFDRIVQIQARRPFDLVQVLGLPDLARRLSWMGIPVALRFPGPPAWFLRWRLASLSRQRAVGVFSHGDTVRLLNDGWAVAADEIPPGVRQDVFRPLPPDERNAERARRNWHSDEVVVSCAGRLVPGKGQELVIRAFARHLQQGARSRLIIAGEGPLRPRLERLAAHLGVMSQVEFTGHRERPEMARILAASDIFALCSDYENYSNAVLEAMATGLPVIATRTGGFPMQVVSGETGYLVNPGDASALAGVMGKLAADAESRVRMGHKARAWVGRFTWRRSAEAALRLYTKLVWN